MQQQNEAAMMSTDERLAYMAEQILRNFGMKGHERAVAATAEHLALFWDPGMKRRAIAMLEDPRMALPDDVRTVFGRLRQHIAEVDGSGDSRP